MKRRYVKLLSMSSVIGFVLIGLLLYQTQAQQTKPGKEKVVEVEIGAEGNAEAQGKPITINRDVNINGTLAVRDNVGIGTASPNRKLHVAGTYTLIQVGSADGANIGTSDPGNEWLMLHGGNEYNGGNVWTARATAASTLYLADGHHFFYGDTGLTDGVTFTPTIRMYISGDNGNVGIGIVNTPDITNILTIQRNSSTDPIADAWTTYSSRRWKTNIQPIADPLDKIQRLRGVSYDWKKDGKHDIGLIAEEVGEVIPEVVAYEENGVDAQSVDYARLVAVLIEGMKAQQKQIDEQQKEIEPLKTAVKSLVVRKKQEGEDLSVAEQH
ncbi:tail fiber domain-containing protein [Candidatus Poribacteria bacterium]|nr:tail fiber domain-containing protein [Candidatus Poribacteria bacterium]